MPDELVLSGHLLLEDGFSEGWLSVEGGTVTSVGYGRPPRHPDGVGVILPGLSDHHTHVGDAAVPPPPDGMGPSEVFAPPDGYKHRMLASLPARRLEAGTAAFLDGLTGHGVVEHTDFREGGVGGVRHLQAARALACDPPRSVVMGRPAAPAAYDPEELDELLPLVDGLGLSSAMDAPRDVLEDVCAHARSASKPVALHCSESRREDLSRVLELEPSFLVHMVFGTQEDFRDLAAAGVPVVVCPRSTARFTRPPPVVEMARAGVELRLGTDNAMLQGPDVLDEVSFLLSMVGVRDALEPLDVLRWALPATKGSNRGRNIGVAAGSRDLAMLAYDGDDPEAFLLGDRACGAELVVTGGRPWRR